MKNESTDAELDVAGQKIADFLGLKKNRETGMYNTNWGTKTNKGLALCVERILEESLSLIHISEPTRRHHVSRMPSSA